MGRYACKRAWRGVLTLTPSSNSTPTPLSQPPAVLGLVGTCPQVGWGQERGCQSPGCLPRLGGGVRVVCVQGLELGVGQALWSPWGSPGPGPMRCLVPSIFGLDITDMPLQRGSQPAIPMMSPCRVWISGGLWGSSHSPGGPGGLREHFLPGPSQKGVKGRWHKDLALKLFSEFPVHLLECSFYSGFPRKPRLCSGKGKAGYDPNPFP